MFHGLPQLFHPQAIGSVRKDFSVQVSVNVVCKALMGVEGGVVI